MKTKQERYEFILKNIKPRDFSIYKQKDYLIKQLLSGKISISEYNIKFSELIGEINNTFDTFVKNINIVNELGISYPDSDYEIIMQHIFRFIQARKREVSTNYEHNTLNDTMVNEVLNIGKGTNQKEGKQLVLKNE